MSQDKSWQNGWAWLHLDTSLSEESARWTLDSLLQNRLHTFPIVCSSNNFLLPRHDRLNHPGCVVANLSFLEILKFWELRERHRSDEKPIVWNLCNNANALLFSVRRLMFPTSWRFLHFPQSKSHLVGSPIRLSLLHFVQSFSEKVCQSTVVSTNVWLIRWTCRYCRVIGSWERRLAKNWNTLAPQQFCIELPGGTRRLEMTRRYRPAL